MTASDRISWTCVYCGTLQNTPDILPVEGEAKPYRMVIKQAAKDGSIACDDCFHALMGRLRR